jgi:hypothetical protein
MSYRDIERRLAELEAQAPRPESEPDPLEEVIASWAWVAEHLGHYLTSRRGWRHLRNQQAWNNYQTWLVESRGYAERTDALAVDLVRDIDLVIAEHGEDAFQAEPYTATVLAVLPEVRQWLIQDGQYEWV